MPTPLPVQVWERRLQSHHRERGLPPPLPCSIGSVLSGKELQDLCLRTKDQNSAGHLPLCGPQVLTAECINKTCVTTCTPLTGVGVQLHLLSFPSSSFPRAPPPSLYPWPPQVLLQRWTQQFLGSSPPSCPSPPTQLHSARTGLWHGISGQLALGLPLPTALHTSVRWLVTRLFF